MKTTTQKALAKAEIIEAIQKLGKLVSSHGAETGHWLAIDIRKLHQKASGLL